LRNDPTREALCWTEGSHYAGLRGHTTLQRSQVKRDAPGNIVREDFGYGYPEPP
jgi:hypothetical protein